MQRLLLTLLIITLSILSGYVIRRMALRASFNADVLERHEADLKRWRVRLGSLALYVLIPLSAMLSLWGLTKPDMRLAALPAFGLTAWMAGGALALIFARFMHLTRSQSGAFFCCGTFTNIGAVGTLVAVLHYGETAIAVASLYRLLEELYFFLIACPVASHFGDQPAAATGATKSFQVPAALKYIVVALIAGVLMNRLSIPRPAILGSVATVAMLLATVAFLLSIGLSLKIGKTFSYPRVTAALFLIKFFLVPLLITGLGFVFGLSCSSDQPVLQIVFILSAMPVAMNALIPATLYELDVDCANALWLTSTVALTGILPLIDTCLTFF